MELIDRHSVIEKIQKMADESEDTMVSPHNVLHVNLQEVIRILKEEPARE